MTDLWEMCQAELRQTISEQQFQTWIRPLQADVGPESITLAAPNRFVLEWVRDKFLKNIEEIVRRTAGHEYGITISLSDRKTSRAAPSPADSPAPAKVVAPQLQPVSPQVASDRGRLNPSFTFDNFVTGKANQLARAAALQIAEHPGEAYNPLFVYGGVGLGKTHLIHAIGNFVLKRNPGANIRYSHAEQYVSDVIRAYQHKSFDAFKKFYHSLDLLLIDDIQFFSGKKDRKSVV